ncbi:hypothetical protein HYX16_05610 [Candidatus Woesearchaeota archaeon]|nr:hypothetical protein [Candidatus Woesearchaeota archaeon]
MSLENKIENTGNFRRISSKLLSYVLGASLALIPAYGCKKGGGGGGSPIPSPGPTNSTPIITSNPITNSDEGQGYAYDVNASDADNDPLTYILLQNPNGMTINSGNGLISWADPKDGNHPVTVQVSDGKGGLANQSYILTINNQFDDISGKVKDILRGNVVTNGVDVMLAHKDQNGDVLSDFIARSDINGNYLLSRIPTDVSRLVILDGSNYLLHKSGTLRTTKDVTNLDLELIPDTFNLNFYNEVARNPVDGGQIQRWLNKPQVYINTSPALGSGNIPTQQEIDLAVDTFRNKIPLFNNGFTDSNITITIGTNPPAYGTPGFIRAEWDDSTGALGIHGEFLNGNEIVSGIVAVKTGLNGSQQIYVNGQEISQVFGARNDSNLVPSIFNDPQTPGVDTYQQVDLDTGRILYKRPIGNKSESARINGVLRTILDSNPDNTPVQ